MLRVQVASQLSPQVESRFTSTLWEKISAVTKKILVENNFIFPMNLQEPYRYYTVDKNTFVMDFGTTIGRGKMGGICLGQNLITNEFVAFKTISYNTDTTNENHQEVVGARNLKRLKGLIVDVQEKAVYMAIELIDGVTLPAYDWKKHSNSIAHALNLALSYLDEIEFVAESKVNQSDQNPANTMVDLKKNKVFLIDFAGPDTFNNKTASFRPDPCFPCISIVDLSTIIDLLPRPRELEERQMLTQNYQDFYSSLQEIRKSGERHEKNIYYFTLTIDELRTKLLSCLQNL
jgi:serine/threonine protein kinase